MRHNRVVGALWQCYVLTDGRLPFIGMYRISVVTIMFI